jgi:hypothetical protein
LQDFFADKFKADAVAFTPAARAVPPMPAAAMRYVDATQGAASIVRRQWDDNVVYIVEL